MKKKIYINWNKFIIYTLCIHRSFSDDRLQLPRDIKGVEILAAAGAEYDNMSYFGEKELIEFSPLFALMTDRFYVDIHKVS